MWSRIKPLSSRALLLIFVLSSVISISSCGWQLRGYEPNVPYNKSNLTHIKISSNTRDNAFFRRFAASLKRNNIQESSDASHTLEIFKELIDRKPLAYDRIGTPSQYKLSVSIEYRFSNDGEILQPLTKVVSRRNYDFDANLIIAKDKEQEALIKEMRDELSQRVIDSINSKHL